MKYYFFYIFLIVFTLIAGYPIEPCFAGIAASKHDMFGGPVQYGTDPNVCSYCHTPHNAVGSKIWSDWGNEAQLTSGPSTPMGNMCYTCHDGTVTSIGQTTAFDASKQQHKIPGGADCAFCHTVHDNTNEKFMNIARSNYSYCAACHNASVNAGGLGDHTPGMANHLGCAECHTYPELSILLPGSSGGELTTCHSCHAKAHGAVNYSTPGVSHPILESDNTDNQLCASCHNGIVQAAAGGDKHPANKLSGPYGKILCEDCHDPHQPGVTNHPQYLIGTNIDSQMCINCHDGSNGPGIGHSHPYGVGFGSIVPADASGATGTPPGNLINDDDVFYSDHDGAPDTKLDYPLNSGNLICETCHSVHHKADDPGTKLLRITNTNGELCNNCHSNKSNVANTKHDMLFMSQGTDTNACNYCHKPHNAIDVDLWLNGKNTNLLWSDWTNEAQINSGPFPEIVPGTTPEGNICYTCHDGTATTVGASTAFNMSLQSHKTQPGKDCHICHSTHDNSRGKFMGIDKKQTSGVTEAPTYCERCHTPPYYPGAGGQGNKLMGNQHPYMDAGSLLDESCDSCHVAHGAANYTEAIDTMLPILKTDNTDSSFCATCHSSHVQATTGGNKHPANLTTAGTWDTVKCEECHDTHNAFGERILRTTTTMDSASCKTCHQPSGTTNGPAIGTNSHPTDVPFATKGLTPSANEIDDDDQNGPDYSGNTASVVCESCHSVHKKGVAVPLLRITDDDNVLCMNCHSDK